MPRRFVWYRLTSHFPSHSAYPPRIVLVVPSRRPDMVRLAIQAGARRGHTGLPLLLGSPLSLTLSIPISDRPGCARCDSQPLPSGAVGHMHLAPVGDATVDDGDELLHLPARPEVLARCVGGPGVQLWGGVVCVCGSSWSAGSLRSLLSWSAQGSAPDSRSRYLAHGSGLSRSISPVEKSTKMFAPVYPPPPVFLLPHTSRDP